VLVIDDDPTFADQLCVALNASGMAGVVASDAGAAAERLAERVPDLIVIDRKLYGQDGFELGRKLKASERTRYVPVIGVSGEFGRDTRIAAASAGLDYFLPKPIEVDELVARARVLLEQSEAARSTADKAEKLIAWREWVRYLVHDMRSPITVALGNLTLAQNALPVDHEAARGIEEASYEVMRVATMLHDLLDTDRLRRGALVPTIEPGDVVDILRRCVGSVAAVATLRGLKIDVVAPAAAPADIDATLIERVCTNLLQNAMRYARERIVVTLTVGEPGVEVAVENDGPGIGASVRDKIFDAWVSLDPTGGVTHGTGLGLAFCRLAAEAHGGRAWLVDGEAGHVVFAFALPARHG
jgi:signal transduction histidine kinase